MKTHIKKGITSIFLVLLSVSFYGQSNTKYTVDVDNSSFHWKGFKPMGSQSGTIKLLSGIVGVENGKITGGNFVVDMTSIKDNDGSLKLERHLKSVDFFDIEMYPTSNFVIKSIKIKNNLAYLVGDLTIKNVTKQMAIPVVIIVTQNNVEIKTETFKINRADFNVKYKSKSFFNNLKNSFIRDKFELQITIIAKN